MSRKILLTDLRDPRLTDDQRRLMTEAPEVELSVQAAADEAARRTGLEDFGPDDWRARLQLIFDDVDAWDTATNLVRNTFYQRAIAVLVNRLLFLDRWRRHPEILERRIERPLIIAGLPRSGTTHLLNLLAAGERFSSLRFWESVQPVPLPGEPVPADVTADPRYLRSTAAWERLQRINPMMAPYHPMDPDHIHEDLELQVPNMATYYWEWMGRVPRWRDFYYAEDQRPHYRFGRDVLKILDAQHDSTRRWVLKTPAHFEQIPAIMDVYPDALLLFTHRDPVASLQSIVTQLAYVIRTRESPVDPDWYAAYWIDRVETLLKSYVRDVEQVPAEQRFDVRFDEFMADDLAMARRIHEAAGETVDDALSARFQHFLDTHQRHQHGAIDHDLERDFGLDVDALRERFSFYTDHAGLTPERA